MIRFTFTGMNDLGECLRALRAVMPSAYPATQAYPPWWAIEMDA